LRHANALRNLRAPLSLQALSDDLLLVWFQRPEQAFDGLDQHGGLYRRRISTRQVKFQTGRVTRRLGLEFTPNVPPSGSEVVGSVAALVERQADQESPQLVAGIQPELALVATTEKALEDRLKYVLGVFLSKDTAMEVASRQCDQPPGVLLHHANRCALIASTDSCQQVGK
jgi:hypothetical protein